MGCAKDKTRDIYTRRTAAWSKENSVGWVEDPDGEAISNCERPADGRGSSQSSIELKRMTTPCERSEGDKEPIVGGTMSLLQRIDEKLISTYDLFGNEIHRVEQQIKGLIDIMMSDNPADVDYDFFDLHGTVLLYGIPGIGKTSVMSNCMNYALDQYGADCYELMSSNIVEADLGKATKNLSDALQEFEREEKGILFIDEIDRLCVNRKNDEISELKRMLIELMQFFDRQKAANKKVILCCTNVFEQIDGALVRRFAICEEIGTPTKEELVEFANVCMEKAKMAGRIIDISNSSINTFDDVKKSFRNSLLMHSDRNDSFILEEA